MDPTTKSYVKMLLDNFIKNKIHKRGVLLNEDSSEELTIEFLNDMTSAQIIITDEDKTEAKSLIENIISKHRLLQRQFGIAFKKKKKQPTLSSLNNFIYNNFNYELAKENQHSLPTYRFHQFQRWITQIPNRRTQTTTLS
jgi:hypothetical protein